MHQTSRHQVLGQKFSFQTQKRYAIEAIRRPLKPDCPFGGSDLWSCYELSWLNPNQQRQTAIGLLEWDAHSPFIPESKSLKYFLWSLNFKIFPHAVAYAQYLERKLSLALQTRVRAVIFSETEWRRRRELETKSRSLLTRYRASEKNLPYFWHCANFQSYCPVTHQPDYAEIGVAYEAEKTLEQSLTERIGQHIGTQAFHEQCVEGMAQSLHELLPKQRFSIWGRFTRRGGIDINPFRSNWERRPHHLPSPRQ